MIRETEETVNIYLLQTLKRDEYADSKELKYKQ